LPPIQIGNAMVNGNPYNFNFSPLSMALMMNVQPALNPDGNTLAFAAGAQIKNWYPGYPSNYDGFNFATYNALLFVHFYLLRRNKETNELINIEALIKFLLENSGSTKSNSHANEHLRFPKSKLSFEQKRTWFKAKRNSSRSIFSLYADFLNPVSAFKFFRFGKQARHIYEKSQRDRQNIVGNLAAVAFSAPPLARSDNGKSAQQLEFMKSALASVRTNNEARKQLIADLNSIQPGEGKNLYLHIKQDVKNSKELVSWQRLAVVLSYIRTLIPAQSEETTEATPTAEFTLAREMLAELQHEALADAGLAVNDMIDELALEYQRNPVLSEEEEEEKREQLNTAIAHIELQAKAIQKIYPDYQFQAGKLAQLKYCLNNRIIIL
jgi:hypothetical protein